MVGLKRNHRKSSEEKSVSTNDTGNGKRNYKIGPNLTNKIPQISKTFDQYFFFLVDT